MARDEDENILYELLVHNEWTTENVEKVGYYLLFHSTVMYTFHPKLKHLNNYSG